MVGIFQKEGIKIFVGYGLPKEGALVQEIRRPGRPCWFSEGFLAR